jgi:hypothetical protein
MKLTVGENIILGLVIIVVLCVLIVWAALRKPLEHKKIFAMSGLIVQAKTGPDIARQSIRSVSDAFNRVRERNFGECAVAAAQLNCTGWTPYRGHAILSQLSGCVRAAVKVH